jgi:hypothetical protein
MIDDMAVRRSGLKEVGFRLHSTVKYMKQKKRGQGTGTKVKRVKEKEHS